MSVIYLVSMRGALFLYFIDWVIWERLSKVTCSLTFKSCDKNYRHWSMPGMRTRRFNGINGHRCQYSKDNHPHSKTDNLKRKRTCDEKLHQLCTSRTFAIIVLRGNVQISSRTVSMTSGYRRLFVVFDGDDEAETGFPFCVIAGRRVCEHPAKEKNNIL